MTDRPSHLSQRWQEKSLRSFALGITASVFLYLKTWLNLRTILATVTKAEKRIHVYFQTVRRCCSLLHQNIKKETQFMIETHILLNVMFFMFRHAHLTNMLQNSRCSLKCLTCSRQWIYFTLWYFFMILRRLMKT